MDAQPSVLIVEDEALIVMAMQDALEGGGFTVLLASNGTEAIALLNIHHKDIACLVTDIRLGSGPSGWEVARHARRLKLDIAIVYTSGDSVAQWPAEGLPNSVILQKPFADAQLLTAVSNEVTEAGNRS